MGWIQDAQAGNQSPWVQEAQACVILEEFRREEIRRLDEKARLMRADQFDERSRQSDALWRRQNEDILYTAEALLMPPPPSGRTCNIS